MKTRFEMLEVAEKFIKEQAAVNSTVRAFFTIAEKYGLGRCERNTLMCEQLIKDNQRLSELAVKLKANQMVFPIIKEG